MPAVRPPAVAGTFYPDSPDKLTRELDELIPASPEPLQGTLRGLISPHAGYAYSGSIAGRAYGLLRGKTFDAVIVVGPSHREYFYGVSLFPGEAFKTPLGEVPVHKEIRSALINQNEHIFMSEAGHKDEHSVEVQLPFLQRVFQSMKFVPIVMGDQNRGLCQVLAEQLAQVSKDFNVLLVASSDLSHYHEYRTAVALDQKVVDRLREFDSDGLLKLFENEEAEACGGGPMAAVMMGAGKAGANHCHVLSYCNSGDVTGEKDRVVGYVSAAITQVN